MTVYFQILTNSFIVLPFHAIVARTATIYMTGYWIDNWIYWITINYTQPSPLQLQLTLTTESQLLLSLFRAQDLLQTQLALTGHQLTLLRNSPSTNS
jgi:hypothetical protein